MPDPRIIRPLPALAGEFDPKPFLGANLFSRTNNNLVTNNAAMPSTAPKYMDLLAFLHGYGSRTNQSLGGMINATLSQHGVWSVGFDDNDRFYIENDANAWTLDFANPSFTGSHLTELGFEGNNIAAVAQPSGAMRVTAPKPWRRGPIQLSYGLGVQIQGQHLGALIDAPRVQCLPVWVRERGQMNDADDIYSGLTLEDLDPDTQSRWLVEADGRVSVSFFLDGGYEILNSAWWRRLGGDGTETPVSEFGTGRHRLTTANPAPCFLASRRGYVNLRRRTTMRDSRQMMTDGSIVSASMPVVRGWDLTLRLEGPAQGFDRDHEDHLRAWWDHARGPLTLYPAWGDGDYAPGAMDTRRHVDRLSVDTSARYTSFQTAGADSPDVHFSKRQGGRLLVRLHPSDDQNRRERYELQKDVHQDVVFRLTDDTSR